MEITIEMYENTAQLFPKPKNTPKINNLELLNAILKILVNRGKWRSLKKNGHTIYTRANRWAKNQRTRKNIPILTKTKKRILCLYSTCIEVYPDFHEALKKSGKQPIGRTKERFMRIFIRYDQRDSVFLLINYFAFIFHSLFRVNIS